VTVASPAPTRLGWPVWRLAGVVVVGAFLSMLDGSIVAVGLDTVARDLHVGLAEVAWVSNAYLLALAVSLPLCGWAGRRIGVGRLWLGALAAFTLTSGVCALAGDLTTLVVARVAQGLAAGLLVPAGQTLLGQAVGPERLGRVMGVLGLAVSAGPALGPALGGLLLDSFSWPALFLVNVPIGVLGLVAGLRVVPRGETGRAGPLDVVGLVLVGVGLPATLFALTTLAGPGGTAPAVVGTLVVGVLTLAGFVRRTLRTRHPLTDLSLLRRPVFAAACVSSGLVGALMFGSLLVLPLWFQLRQGAGVIDTGLALIGFGVGTAVAGPLAGWLTDRVGGGRVAVVGVLVVVATTVPFAFLAADAPVLLVQALLVVRGLATGLAAVPVTVVGYAAVSAEALPDAATQLNVVQRVGGAAGGALVAVVVARGLVVGPDVAFGAAFLVLAGVGVLALGATTWLARVA
jgi:EmrB/QacA subfamily drug resistance transporter